MAPVVQRRSLAPTAASLSGEQGREFQFTAAVPRATVAAFVPRPFRAADALNVPSGTSAARRGAPAPTPGKAWVVASVRRFANLAVESAEGPGALAELGVVVDALGGHTGRHVYTLWWGTDRADLADRLAARTLHVAHLPQISVTDADDRVAFEVPLPGGIRLEGRLEHDTLHEASHTGWHARDGVVTRIAREADVRRARRGEGTLRAAPATVAARLLGAETVHGSVTARSLDTVEAFERITDA